MDFTSALQTFREAMVATQNGIVEAFVDRLTTIPRRLRPAEPDALVRDNIDVRLDLFAMWYWDVRYWPLAGWGIPEDVDPVTTLDGLSSVLPSILKDPISGTDGTLPPKPDEVREEYLRALHELVMAKARSDHAPPSLPAEYESLLKLTDGLHMRDLLNERICEVGGTLEDGADIERSVPDPEELEEYEDWEVSAGFVLGEDHESTCKYIYCRNTGDEADELERDWGWRVSFTSFSHATQDPYIGDLAGFLHYYPNIYIPEKIQEYVGFRVRDTYNMAKDDQGLW
jgi:hypothetical protein